MSRRHDALSATPERSTLLRSSSGANEQPPSAAWTYRQPFWAATACIPGNSARPVESPMTATTGDRDELGLVAHHGYCVPTVPPPVVQTPGSLVSVSCCARLPPTIAVVCTIRRATR